MNNDERWMKIHDDEDKRMARRRALPFPNMASAGTVWFVEDEEVDFDVNAYVRCLLCEPMTLNSDRLSLGLFQGSFPDRI